ncbi:MAG TPA: helicase C-terminal domain-containing protein, partial [Verrucomicrobiae bacterium]|nr:helicase C-terminal domain-containing protein [Verrucomicrobiae bacterium]
ELVEMTNSSMDAIALALLEKLKVRERRGEHKLRVTEGVYGTPLWGETEKRVAALAKAFLEYAAGIKKFLRSCEKMPENVQEKFNGLLVDLKGIRGRVESVAQELSFFVSRDPAYCRWFEVKCGPKGMAVRLCSSPLAVAPAIKQAVWDRFRTVILTSATLAVGERFTFLRERTGLNLVAGDRVRELLLPSPFDYRRQAFVGIPSDLPDPTTPGFGPKLQDGLLRALAVSGGRAFVLFTSYDLLRRTYDALAGDLRRMGLTPMRQGEMNRHLLLQKFRAADAPVLFGTDSFWEGVDVKGRGLELVAITRLPFRVPTEPVLEARSEEVAARGGDPFMEYTIPQAVIRFKQGFGRLIRSRDDRGCVLILDSRVLSKGYGRRFLDALPPVEPLAGRGEDVYAAMQSFFSAMAPIDPPA